MAFIPCAPLHPTARSTVVSPLALSPRRARSDFVRVAPRLRPSRNPSRTPTDYALPHIPAALVRMALPGVPESSLTVLVVGAGGREHALVKSLARSPYLKTLLAAPGNVGIAAHCECLPEVDAEDVDGIVALAVERAVSLVIVGPEVPLVLGLVDRLAERNILAFGPTAAAAQLEGSKLFSKCFLERHDIPTAMFSAFDEVEPARLCVRDMGVPVVIKASGLAAGKGVVVARTQEEAFEAIDDMLVRKKYGDAGLEVLVERFVTGEELSFFAIVDGDTAVPLASAQDHKPAYDGDSGPNTGGMGAYSPAPLCDASMRDDIMERVVRTTVRGMREEGNPFRGVLYCGLMVDARTGSYNVLEFNVRFGDPECQVLCERLRSDLLEVLYRAATGSLEADGFELEWDERAAVVVVMATKGYPGKYEKGSVISGLDKADALQNVTVYHAGTASGEGGQVVASGGRVLGVTALGDDVAAAQKRAYEGVDAIEWEEGFCRRDIGWRAIERAAAVQSVDAGSPA